MCFNLNQMLHSNDSWSMTHRTRYTISWKAFVCFTWRIRIKETSCIRYSDVTVEQETENWQLIGCQFWLVTRLLLGNIRKSLLPNYLYNSKPLPQFLKFRDTVTCQRRCHHLWHLTVSPLQPFRSENFLHSGFYQKFQFHSLPQSQSLILNH